MDRKIEFVYDSIHDIQSTVRAIDTKIATILVVIVIPLTSLGEIVGRIDTLWTNKNILFNWIIVILFGLFWILSFILASLAIAAIENPSKHVRDINNPSNIYYGEGLYKKDLRDVFLNRSNLKSIKNVDAHYADFPDNDEDIVKELVFEQMKLIYIRELKIIRFNYSLYATYIWFTFGLIIYFLS